MCLIVRSRPPVGKSNWARVMGMFEITADDKPHYHGAHQVLSTFRGQAGILVGVHSVLRESLRFGNISVPGPGQMDNLLKVHS
jgi:uncharacterized protein YjlB